MKFLCVLSVLRRLCGYQHTKRVSVPILCVHVCVCVCVCVCARVGEDTSQRTLWNKRSWTWPWFRGPVQSLGTENRRKQGARLTSLVRQLSSFCEPRTLNNDECSGLTVQVSNYDLNSCFSRLFCVAPSLWYYYCWIWKLLVTFWIGSCQDRNVQATDICEHIMHIFRNIFIFRGFTGISLQDIFILYLSYMQPISSASFWSRPF